jgi:diguanylate cyclase (GGDEF)-like protein/PAS domain S-box-containing protein
VADTSKYGILVVEDDSIIAEDVSQALARMGYEVVSTAESGEEAIKKAATLSPDLVLMDIVLKGAVDGIKAARHITVNLEIPVVYLTSHSDKATFRRAKETGPFGYLMKPYEERDLAATVEMALYKHAMESKLKGKEQWLTIILKSMGDGVIVTDVDGKVGFMNPASEGMTGFKARECVGKPQEEILELYEEDTGNRLPDSRVSGLGDYIGGEKPVYINNREGTKISIDGSIYSIKGDMGEAAGSIFVFRDVTEKRRAQKMLEKSERFLNTIFDSIHDPFCIFDRDYNIVRANEAYARLKDTSLEELIDKHCYEVIEGRDCICDNCIVQRTFAEAKPNNKEKPHVIQGVTTAWVEIFTYPIFDEDGEVSHVIEYTRDITDRKRSDEERKTLIEELEYLSTVDPLSGLLNRRALMEFINSEVDRAKRYSRRLSLILCDVDNFKDINDTLGHSAGDEAIRAVSNVFRDVVRRADVVGRYGGDEFLVVMPETSSKGAEEMAGRLLEAVKEKPLKLAKRAKRTLTLSIGVASFDLKDESVDTLITRADAALYESKHAGRDRVTVDGG